MLVMALRLVVESNDCRFGPLPVGPPWVAAYLNQGSRMPLAAEVSAVPTRIRVAPILPPATPRLGPLSPAQAVGPAAGA